MRTSPSPPSQLHLVPGGLDGRPQTPRYEDILQALATAGVDSLSPYDCLHDTAVNCSIVWYKTLLHDLNKHQTVNFDSIGKNLTISYKGHLGSLCDAYYHSGATVNIIFFSNTKSPTRTKGGTLSWTLERVPVCSTRAPIASTYVTSHTLRACT